MHSRRHTPFELIKMHGENWRQVDTPAHTFLLLLAATREQLGSHVLGICEEHGITTSEFDVLAALRRSAPPYEQTPTEILRRTVVTSGGLTKILYRLEKQGWIERITDEADRRSIRARLTPAGRRLEESAMTKLLSELHWLENALSAGEMAQLIGLLGKLWAAGEAASTLPDR